MLRFSIFCLPVWLLMLLAALATAAGADTLRTWTDTTGSYRTEARLVGVEDGKVRLKKKNGAVITVPLGKLSAADQEYARRWAASLPAAESRKGLREGKGLQRKSRQHASHDVTFTIREAFGVNHPDQIIDFDVGSEIDPARTSLIGPDGREVPYQLIEGGKKIAVRTDLPAGARYTWRLIAGKASSPYAQAVAVAEKNGCYEITNHLVGIRVTTGADKRKAPIQGIRYRDGTWSGSGPNLLSVKPDSVAVKFLEKGPLKVVVRVRYRIGGGYYVSTIEVQSGQPSIVIEEEADGVPVSYEFDIRGGLNPDRARYRCHKAEPWHGPGPEDETGLGGNRTLRLAVWDPWIHDGGWQIQVFSGAAPASANLFGMFQGPTSRALGAGNSGMRLICRDNQVLAQMQLAPQQYYGTVLKHNRFCWGIFLGTRGDLAPADQIQEIDRQRNLHSGINLNKLHRLVLDFPEPPGKYGSMYMSRDALDRLIKRVRTDESYYQFLYNGEPYFREMLDMWRDASGRKVKQAVKKVEDKARETLDVLLHAHGIMDKRVHYYEGVFNIVNELYRADQVLASDTATAEDRLRVKKAVVLFASIWTDDNHTPAQDNTGLNYGTANMPLTFGSYRDMFTTYLARHPAFENRARQVVSHTDRILRTQINEHGSHMGGMHYIEASFSAMAANMLLLKQAGIADFFKSDGQRDHRLTKFAEFMMNAVTPPEPRFGNLRKLIATGDGSTESADRFGILATGFADVNKELCMRLMGAWRQGGSRHSSMFGSSILKIDDELPDKDPALGSANFPGYYSVLREGWGTKNETAVWFINGDWYRDHKHPGDGGEVIIYALGAPLSIDFGSMYSPRSAGPEYHSVVQPGGTHPRLEAFEKNVRGGFARASFELPNNVKWTRAVSLAMLKKDLPVIAIQDTFIDSGEKTWQLNLMADGAVETPEGARSSGQRFALNPGVTQLHVIGQTWLAHSTKGIDWNVYFVTAKPQQAELGQWGHNWHPSVEQYQFQQANGRGFQERQHILKAKGEGPFRAFIVPCFKGQKPVDISVKMIGNNVAVSAGDDTARFTPDGRVSR